MYMPICSLNYFTMWLWNQYCFKFFKNWGCHGGDCGVTPCSVAIISRRFRETRYLQLHNKIMLHWRWDCGFLRNVINQTTRNHILKAVNLIGKAPWSKKQEPTASFHILWISWFVDRSTFPWSLPVFFFFICHSWMRYFESSDITVAVERYWLLGCGVV